MPEAIMKHINFLPEVCKNIVAIGKKRGNLSFGEAVRDLVRQGIEHVDMTNKTTNYSVRTERKPDES